MADSSGRVELRQYDGSTRVLEILDDDDPATAGIAWGGRGSGLVGLGRSGLASAEVTFFELAASTDTRASRRPRAPGARFRDPASGLLSTLYREIVIRVRPDTSARRLSRLLRSHGVTIKRRNEFVEHQLVVSDPLYTKAGVELVDVANALTDLDEIEFATPNFVSEFGRAGGLAAASEQWHLPLVRAPDAWQTSTGKRVVVAVLDDGVELTHPALRKRLWRNKDRQARDVNGRDFFARPEESEHWDPSPKVAGPPWAMLGVNDLHGTMCAGLIAAAGAFPGVAADARILPVRVFSGNQMTAEEHVANAIRYAGQHAQVLSCSWFGGTAGADIHFALRDLQAARDGRGVVACFAAGNDNGGGVRYPASDELSIAVGAVTVKKTRAGYSNVGPQLAVVAPGGDSTNGICTTDLAAAGRGTNPGTDPTGLDGAFTRSFWGTSAAAPIAAGVASLVLSKAPRLDAAAVRDVLQSTAARVGPKRSYKRNGHSDEYGFGLVDAAAALAAI